MDRLEEAAAQVQRGDPAAFQRIVEATSDLLVRLCARILGNVEDAEDAVQDAYVNLPSVNGGASQKPHGC